MHLCLAAPSGIVDCIFWVLRKGHYQGQQLLSWSPCRKGQRKSFVGYPIVSPLICHLYAICMPFVCHNGFITCGGPKSCGDPQSSPPILSHSIHDLDDLGVPPWQKGNFNLVRWFSQLEASISRCFFTLKPSFSHGFPRLSQTDPPDLASSPATPPGQHVSTHLRSALRIGRAWRTQKSPP